MTRKASRRIFVLRLDVLRNAFRQVKFKFLNLPSGWMSNVPRLTGQLRWETLESLATWQLREEITAHGILPLTSIDKALLSPLDSRPYRGPMGVKVERRIDG